jgi:two-component system chemotaxis response regulator CheY
MEGRYVLTIEHDWRMRKLIRANLEAMGIEVHEAVSGEHGLQLLHEGKPDLILLDLDLPDMDALYLLGTLRDRFRGQWLPIIVMAEEPPGRQLRRHGQSTSYLQKPFAALALLQQVRSALSSVLVDEGQRVEGA